MSANLALVLVLVVPCRLQGHDRDVGAAVEEAVAGVKTTRDVLHAIDALAGLGTSAAQPLFERLCASERGAAPLDGFQAAAIHGALARLPHETCMSLLEHETHATDDDRREVALDLLGRIGGRGELMLALDLGLPAERDALPDPELRDAFERALLGLCDNEEGTARALAALFPRVPSPLQETVAHVIAQAGRDDAANLLGAQLGSAGVEADSILLLELAEIGRYRSLEEDQLPLEQVRGMLGAPDARLRVLACLACEKLRDHDAVPDLVVMLEDTDPNLRQRAHAALRSLTGLTFGDDPAQWLAWLSDGLAWWDERAEPCRVALVSGESAAAAASVQEVARQRLFVHHAATILALALQRPEPDIVKSACRALGTMREREALQALLTVTDNADPSIAAEARAALHRIEDVPRPTIRSNPDVPRLRNSQP